MDNSGFWFPEIPDSSFSFPVSGFQCCPSKSVSSLNERISSPLNPPYNGTVSFETYVDSLKKLTESLNISQPLYVDSNNFGSVNVNGNIVTTNGNGCLAPHHVVSRNATKKSN